MPPIWTCPRGHQWEQDAAPPHADTACPVCGITPVGPLLKPDMAPGNTAEGMAETRQRAADSRPLGFADVPVRQAPPTKPNPLTGRPAPVAGNLDDTLMPGRVRPAPPPPSDLDETMMRPMKVPPQASASQPPAPTSPPQAKGCFATASAVLLAVFGVLAVTVAALARS